MSRIIHASVDVGGLLTWDNRDLRRWLKAFKGQKFRTVSELRAYLVSLLAEGYEMLPCGEPCEGFSPKQGCPGHREELAE